MKKSNKKSLYLGLFFLAAFILWTCLVQIIDVADIGANESKVGFAALNKFFCEFIGVNKSLYHITDWLGIVPFAVATGFGFLGLLQWIRRKKLKYVDYDIFVLAAFYVVVMTVYVFFEIYVVNYRPILIDGRLEASYPSSTTMLTLTVMPTAIMQFNARIKREFLAKCLTIITIVLIAFMVIGRLISGVHWVTDIIGGALVSVALVMTYRFFCSLK